MCYNVLTKKGEDVGAMLDNNYDQIPHCGEIWTCHLGDNDPGVQSGYRPVLILSNDRNNLFSAAVNVAPLTTRMNKRRLPVHIELWDYEAYGLKAPSTILIEQTTTVNINRLDFRIGKISDENVLRNVWKAIETQFAIRDNTAFSMAS